MRALITLVAMSSLWAADDLTALERRVVDDPEGLRAAAVYRQAIIASGSYDRAIATFDRLAKRPGAGANAYLNLAFAYIDKVPVSGLFRQLSLGNSAIRALTRSIEIAPSPLTYFVRGRVYLYYERGLFHRTDKGVADLEEARRLVASHPETPYIPRILIALGDGYFRLTQRQRARDTWRDALAKFPQNEELRKRTAASDEDVRAIIKAALDPNVRVDTSLRELYPDLQPIRTNVGQ